MVKCIKNANKTEFVLRCWDCRMAFLVQKIDLSNFRFYEYAKHFGQLDAKVCTAHRPTRKQLSYTCQYMKK